MAIKGNERKGCVKGVGRVQDRMGWWTSICSAIVNFILSHLSRKKERPYFLVQPFLINRISVYIKLSLIVFTLLIF